MKTAQVNKLYKQLTPTELANLAIDAWMRFDSEELDLIVGSVERVTYDGIHYDYQKRLRGFERLALELMHNKPIEPFAIAGSGH